ncbi:MAG: hypothetical protein RBT03_00275 [Kiritimatiellia bacterium]|jgi:hypothetical protein|nr:hypothetical protein [Kiritimatiellia bacterium]
MRAIDWQSRLQRQREEYRKVVFTRAELANLAGAQPESLSIALQRLVKKGVLIRYASARYGLPGAVAPEDLVPTLDSSAYLTGLFALYRHRMVTQMPTEIVCFSRRRHNRSRVRQTPLGRIVFICVESAVYAMPQEGVLAAPEQALCDYVFLCRKRGVAAASLVTFRNLDRLDSSVLDATLPRYSATVRQEVARILGLKQAPKAEVSITKGSAPNLAKSLPKPCRK